jgi:hypothetical protein
MLTYFHLNLRPFLFKFLKKKKKKKKKQIQRMAGNEGDSVGSDINRLVASIEAKMPHGLLMPPNCCIFKIPVILFRHNEKAFIPNAFSIGPLHHGQSNLKATKKIKAKYLQDLISRSYSPNTMLRTIVTHHEDGETGS